MGAVNTEVREPASSPQLPFTGHQPGNVHAKYQHFQMRYFNQLNRTFSLASKREDLNFVLGFLLKEKEELV